MNDTIKAVNTTEQQPTQVLLRDTPQGMPVKTNVRAGLKRGNIKV